MKYRPIPEGIYVVRLMSTQEIKSASGKEFMRFRWGILSPNYNNCYIDSYVALNNKPAEAVFKIIIKSLGLDPSVISFENISLLYHKECFILVELKTIDKRLVNNITRYYPIVKS